VDYDDANEQATGAPGPLTLGGRTFLVTAPSDETFAALRIYLKQRLRSPLAVIAEELDSLPPKYRQQFIDAAVKTKAGGGADLTSAYVEEQLLQPHGCAYLVWLLARPNTPGLTLEEVTPLVTPDNVTAVLSDLYAASGMETLGKDPGRSGSSNGAAPTARKPTAISSATSGGR
jgi:hypothetical protein